MCLTNVKDEWIPFLTAIEKFPSISLKVFIANFPWKKILTQGNLLGKLNHLNIRIAQKTVNTLDAFDA
jgi:hypothetical protein